MRLIICLICFAIIIFVYLGSWFGWFNDVDGAWAIALVSALILIGIIVVSIIRWIVEEIYYWR